MSLMLYQCIVVGVYIVHLDVHGYKRLVLQVYLC